jgi:transcriptional regulator with XRE-family HTH domain
VSVAVLEHEPVTAGPVIIGPDTWNRLLGANLRAMRMAYGLSLADVTRLSGGRIRAARLCSYELGTRQLHPEGLEEVAAFYGVRAADLIPPVTRSPWPVEEMTR